MYAPPEDALERAVWENLMAYTYERKKLMQINSALMGVYGSLLAAGGSDAVEIDDLLKEMAQGL